MILSDNIIKGDSINKELEIRQGFRKYNNEKYSIINDLFKVSFKRDFKNKGFSNTIEIRNRYIKFIKEVYKIEFILINNNGNIRITGNDRDINEYMIYKSIEYINNSKEKYTEVNMANVAAIYPCYIDKEIYHLKRIGDYIYKIYDHRPMIDETSKYKNYIITHSEKVLLEKSIDNNIRNLLKILFKTINERHTILYIDEYTDDILSSLNKNFLKQFFDIREYNNHPIMEDYFKDKFL